jgi:hypothetical protein
VDSKPGPETKAVDCHIFIEIDSRLKPLGNNILKERSSFKMEIQKEK